jgi:hypothetical protein
VSNETTAKRHELRGNAKQLSLRDKRAARLASKSCDANMQTCGRELQKEEGRKETSEGNSIATDAEKAA